jgi:hypothetical protein
MVKVRVGARLTAVAYRINDQRRLLPPAVLEHFSGSPHLDQIPERGAGAVALDIAHIIGFDAGIGQESP